MLATGYYDIPNLIGVPGEHLEKVLHYYKEAHAYYNQDVIVVGAKNSAAIARKAKGPGMCSGPVKKAIVPE